MTDIPHIDHHHKDGHGENDESVNENKIVCFPLISATKEKKSKVTTESMRIKF